MPVPSRVTSSPGASPEVSPGASLLSRSAVEDVAAMLPEWLETVRRLHRQPGFQAAIWHDGELVAEVAVGSADESAGIPLRTTHRLRIASHSKTFTALAIMRLREQGRLRLDDTVGDHVGELAGSPVADRTLRDLLSHSAGLTRDSDDSRWWRLGTPFPDRERLLEIARTGAVKAEASGRSRRATPRAPGGPPAARAGTPRCCTAPAGRSSRSAPGRSPRRPGSGPMRAPSRPSPGAPWPRGRCSRRGRCGRCGAGCGPCRTAGSAVWGCRRAAWPAPRWSGTPAGSAPGPAAPGP